MTGFKFIIIKNVISKLKFMVSTKKENKSRLFFFLCSRGHLRVVSKYSRKILSNHPVIL
jgi:hypothetical protein